MERNSLIDILRGIAALLIIGQHITTFFSDLLLIILMQASISLPLFFVLSGFLTAYVAKIDVKWIAKRVFQVMIPFIAYGIASQMLWSVDAIPYYTNLFLSGGLANGLWFFVTIAWCFILISVVGIFRFKGFWWMSSIALILIIIAAFTSYILLSSTGIYNFVGISCIVSYFPFFFAGYLLNIYKHRFAAVNNLYFIAPSLVIFPVFMFLCFRYNVLTESLTKYWTFLDFNIMVQLAIRVLQIFLGLVFAYTIANLLIKLPIMNKILAWIGKNTIAFYGIQGFLISKIIIQSIPIFVMYLSVLVLCSAWSFLISRFDITKILFAGSWESATNLFYALKKKVCY
jgi:hypothetical protein